MLFAGHRIDFIFQHAQGSDDARAGFAGLDHVIDIAALGGDERVGEALPELGDFLLAQAVFAGVGKFTAVDDVNGAFGAHDRDFGGGPGEIYVRADVLGAHHAIGAAVSL